MIPVLITVSLLLRFATANTSDEQQLNGDLFSTTKSHLSASTVSVSNIERSESMNSIVLQEAQTGYFVDAEYIDATCTAISSAFVHPLNICTFAGTEYFFAVSDGTTITKNIFSDVGCTTVKDGPEVLKIGACIDKEKHYVQSTSKVTSTQSILTTTIYGPSDKSCAQTGGNNYVVVNAVDVCFPIGTTASEKDSVLGNKVTQISYQTPDCTGTPSNTTTATLNSCAYRGKYNSFTSLTTSTFDILNKLKACFAGSEIVALESGETKAISEVKVGDRVLAADSSRRTLFSEVVFVPHGANTDKAFFTHITTTQGRDIKITHSHILPAGVCESALPLPDVYASAVTVGDCIMTVSGKEKVSAVETVPGEGLYTIVTKDEYVVVNGIIASPFAFNHMAANLFYNMHRFIYACAPSLLNSPLVRSANEALGLLIPLAGVSV